MDTVNTSATTKKDYLLQAFLVVSKSEHLHLGYSKDPNAVFTSNSEVRDAQEAYLQLCADFIPEDVKTVLDVGCGTGEMLLRMHNKGLDVKGLIPDEILIEKIKEKVPSVEVFLNRFEKFQPQGQNFDLLLFMESMGYIKDIDSCYKNCNTLLESGGYVLVCDFFAKGGMVDGKPDVYNKNFHSVDSFKKTFVENGNFEIVNHLDISANTVPTMRFCNGLFTDYVDPVLEIFATSTIEKYNEKKSLTMKLLSMIFGKKIKEKYEGRHKLFEQFSEEYYTKHCSYELFLLKKK